MAKLDGQVALITGSGRGIGRAIASLFAAEGARITVTARSADEIESAAEEIRAAGGEAIAVRGEVTDEADVSRVVEETVDRFGQIDILVNNAAANLPSIDLIDIEPDDWRRVIDVNINGLYLCTRAVIPHMTSRGSGKIINISSIGGRRGGRGRGPYRVTKAGMINLTETLAAELRGHGISVNCICPGGVDTEMMRMIAGGGPRPDLMQPVEIARLALFLASDDSSAITGTSIDAFGSTNPLFG
jgi:NAD(P)-dependent dehydrogenase (short-subunit alcohol dehydrogenase family)